MNKIFTLVFFISALALLNAQTVAEDWTRTDCDGIEHHLYTELEAGYCVVMEFAMLPGCMPCITAAQNIEPVVDEFNATYDNRVKYYTFGYNDIYTCETIQAWRR